MTEADRLARSYRRLLWAYPRWHRRVRGAEMLTTLLDASAPGQHRPGVRDALDLFWRGMRCRLRPPRGVGYGLVTAVAALFAALAGLAAAELLVPLGAPPEAQAVTAAAAALPQRPDQVLGPAAPCTWCPRWDRGPLDRRHYVGVAFNPPTADVATQMALARDRLEAAGWRVDPEVTEDLDSGTLQLRADKDGTALTLFGEPAGAYLDKDLSRPDPAFVSMQLVVTERPSAATVLAMVAGLLGGLLAGWLTAAWLLHRLQRRRGRTRAAMLVTGLPALLAAGIWDAQAAQWALGLTVSGQWSSNSLRLPAFVATIWPTRAAATATVVLVALAVAVAAAVSPTASPAEPRGGT